MDVSSHQDCIIISQAIDIDRETISKNIFHNSWHIRLLFYNLCFEVRLLYTSLIQCVSNILQENMMTITLCRVLFFFSLTKKIGLSVVILYHYTKNENILNPTHVPAGEKGFIYFQHVVIPYTIRFHLKYCSIQHYLVITKIPTKSDYSSVYIEAL